MSTQDALAYAYTTQGFAHCFLRDIVNMRADPKEPLYWLGEVPCVVVIVVAIVVGVKEYDENTAIWLDDGSTVLESRVWHVEVQLEPKSMGSPTKKDKLEETKDVQKKKRPPFDIPHIGSTVRVMGKVRQGFKDVRMIRIDELTECPYGGIEEATHWKHVIELHNTKYSQPFIRPTKNTIPIPATPHKTVSAAIEEATPRPKVLPQFASPESVHSVASVDPARISAYERSPQLRHPSRLRKHDLNTLTFRLYVKHFMGHAYAAEECQRTPIKRPRKRRKSVAAEEPDGFGLSYLRRVPELHELAVRVVHAERKRVEKRKLKLEKENIGNTSSSIVSKPKKRPFDLKRDTKRLFGEALRMLVQDGLIVTQEARSRRWDDREAERMERLRMWKCKNTETQAHTTEVHKSRTLATISEISVVPFDQGEFVVSDEDEDEECFVPVTSALLSEPLLTAIRNATGRSNTARLKEKRPKALGASEEEILEQLHNSDERWARIWDITAALKKLEHDEETYEVSEGVWAILF